MTAALTVCTGFAVSTITMKTYTFVHIICFNDYFYSMSFQPVQRQFQFFISGHTRISEIRLSGSLVSCFCFQNTFRHVNHRTVQDTGKTYRTSRGTSLFHLCTAEPYIFPFLIRYIQTDLERNEQSLITPHRTEIAVILLIKGNFPVTMIIHEKTGHALQPATTFQ